jgi:molybdopterin/thiamine biosynthesis adenylyltransferase/ubiquitin-protein ligase
MGSSNHWHESLPELFNAEIEVLKNGLPNFKFVEQSPIEQTGGIVQILGELSFKENGKQIIQITFPYAYPYTPPEIFPLNAILTPGGIQIQPLMTPMGPVMVKPFNRGNQYSNGKICLFKDEDVWIPFVHTVAMALEQASAWFETALSKDGFTKDLIVEENAPAIGYAGQVLSYLPDMLPEAPGGALKLKSFKENYYSLIEITFQNDKDVVVVNSFPDGTVLSPSRNEIILGRWFKIDGEPKNVLPQLASSQQLKNALAQIYQIPIDDLLPNPQVEAKRTVIGFRIGTSNVMHCFQIYYWKEGISTKFQSTYLLPKNLSKELFARVEALFDINILEKKRVLVVGGGSIGSEVLAELAASGVGFYTVIDEENFDAGNSTRHAADLLYIGESKVEIAKKIIQARNPQAKVNVIPVSIFNLNQDILSKLIDESDVVLDLTANKLVEGYLNQKVCVERKKILLQAAASKGGLTGLVLAIVPGKSACLRCLSERKLNYVPVSNLDTEMLKNTPPDFGACSQPALPASGMDTREIAIQAARVTLQILLQDENSFYPKLSGYQYYWHGAAGTANHSPFEWEIKNAPLLGSCEFCKPND